MTEPVARSITVTFRPGRGASEGKGLLAQEERVRTLLRVLISYPEVRHILPDRISLDAAAEPRVLETVARFLQRQEWLVQSVEIG
ncbi:MAG: hypothetical protein HYY64_18265 [Candidatus Rokubacteria bacterium]|nr:hypothetical protein [Candidatus Rokubacteria bacterium]